jgi:hypothetical protein
VLRETESCRVEPAIDACSSRRADNRYRRS